MSDRSKPVIPKSVRTAPSSRDKLSKTLSDVTREELQKADRMVTVAMAEKEQKERAKAPPKVEPPPHPLVTPDILETSKALNKQALVADKFEAGVDKMTDVLLMLVLKFGRASTFMIATLVLIGVLMIGVTVSVVKQISLSNKLTEASNRMERVENSQKRIAARAKKAQEGQEEILKQLKLMADSAPRAVVGEDGSTVLELPVSESAAAKVAAGKPSKRRPRKAASRPTLKRTKNGKRALRIPLD